jgi:hypothetical protein
MMRSPCGELPHSCRSVKFGFDHGIGRPLLLLYGAKASRGRKNKAFKGLGHYNEWPKVADAVIKASNFTNRASGEMSMGFHLWRGFGALWGRCGPLARWLGL